MSFPEYLRTVTQDGRFVELPIEVQLFFLRSLGELDQPGWWVPKRRLWAAELPQLDLAEAAAHLAPWVTVHPSGAWSIKGYVAVQCPNGINGDSPFFSGMRSRLKAHQAREALASGDPGYVVEGLNSRAGSSSGALDPHPAPVRQTVAQPLADPSATADSQKSKAQSQEPQVSKSHSRPTRGSGGAQVLVAAGAVAVAAAPAPDDEQGDSLEGVLGLFEAFTGPQYNPAPWAIQSLKEAARAQGWAAVRRAAGAYLTSASPGGHSVDGFAKAGTLAKYFKLACDHPRETRRHWTHQLDQYPKGRRVKRWACGAPGCSHVELAASEVWVMAHEHVYVDQPGRGWLVDADGELREVKAWALCTECGHQIEVKP